MSGVAFPKMMDVQQIHGNTIEETADEIIRILRYTSEPDESIYFDGWDGLGASAVLKFIAENPSEGLRGRFDTIIHIDCSRWTNRRALQRTIAEKLRLPQDVMTIFDKQDEEDDFGGVDESYRTEVRHVGEKIHETLQGQRCLLIFLNGSNRTIDLSVFGIPRDADEWSKVDRKVLWTFRGRLRAIPGMKTVAKRYGNNPSNVIGSSHIYLGCGEWSEEAVHQEAREIADYTHRLGVTPGVAASCCEYVLFLNYMVDNILDFNWATHAANYWVCDGIIQECQQDKAWEVAAALHEEMRLENYRPSFRFPYIDPRRRVPWTVIRYEGEEVMPWTTSLFLAANKRSKQLHVDHIFQTSEQLHVLKLCRCSFSFSSPPFLCCQNLRFLGLESCKDQPHTPEDNFYYRAGLRHPHNEKDEDRQQKMDFFRSLWVLDICYTDWDLSFHPNMMEKMGTNIREVNIKRGRIWHSSRAWTWRYLHNIHKLRVIEPTCPWEAGGNSMDEFKDMLKLELLDLSGNSTIQVLPTLSGAITLSTLVLDGCIGLKRVGPEALPASLETFSFDVGQGKHLDKEAKISCISMAGCSRLVNFRLCGSLPNLEELDLSNTSVKTLDLKDEVLQVPCLQRVILLGCERLRSILWPKDGMPKLMVLCIDTRGCTEAAGSKAPHDSLVSKELEPSGRASASVSASVSVTDLRFLQSLLVANGDAFLWKNSRFNINLCLSSTSKFDGQNYSKEKMAPYSSRKFFGSPPHKSLVPRSYRAYSDVNFDEATADHDGSMAQRQQFQPLDLHVEIADGISNPNVITERGIRAVRFFIKRAKSLLVHDNFSINTVIPESIDTTDSWSHLKWCCIERCPKLDAVFTASYDVESSFSELETFWAADLLMARYIWNIGMRGWFTTSFRKLRAIYLHLCPRLTFVLPSSWYYFATFSSLETIHIVYCGDASQVIPAKTDHSMLEFPKLKHVHLHELPRLNQICEAKMFAPELETVWVRGCWSLKRLPATADRPDSRPVVDCEKDWWEKLEWDGKKASHHPSLFEPRHSKYYKKTMLRGTVLY